MSLVLDVGCGCKCLGDVNLDVVDSAYTLAISMVRLARVIMVPIFLVFSVCYHL